LWIAGPKFADNSTGIKVFDPTASSSFQNKNTTFTADMGQTNVKVSLVTDNVQMGGFEVVNQAFGLIDNFTGSDVFNRVYSDVMGLNFKGHSYSQSKPFWENVMKSKKLNKPVMTFNLAEMANQPSIGLQEPGGQFTLGTCEEVYSLILNLI
jgi:hypothetical protein